MKPRFGFEDLVFLAFVLVLGLYGPCACNQTPAPPPLPPGGEPCARACLRLRQLGCEEGGTTPAGRSCESVCENVQGTGYTTLDVDCLQAADSCAAARRCK